MIKSKIDFILASINDIQGTIRAIDNKLIAILVLILLPISKLETIVTVFIKQIEINVFIGYVLLICFLISWTLSLIYALLGLLALENPAKHITDSQKMKGIFFGNKLFNMKWYYSFFPYNIKSTMTLETYLEEFNLSDKELSEELLFEQSKLVFIRNMKIQRQKIAIISILFSTLIGLISWVLVLMKIY
jgi:hypothetical protein